MSESSRRGRLHLGKIGQLLSSSSQIELPRSQPGISELSQNQKQEGFEEDDTGFIFKRASQEEVSDSLGPVHETIKSQEYRKGRGTNLMKSMAKLINSSSQPVVVQKPKPAKSRKRKKKVSESEIVKPAVKRRRGRPKGSKNKNKKGSKTTEISREPAKSVQKKRGPKRKIRSNVPKDMPIAPKKVPDNINSSNVEKPHSLLDMLEYEEIPSSPNSEQVDGNRQHPFLLDSDSDDSFKGKSKPKPIKRQKRTRKRKPSKQHVVNHPPIIEKLQHESKDEPVLDTEVEPLDEINDYNDVVNDEGYDDIDGIPMIDNSTIQDQPDMAVQEQSTKQIGISLDFNNDPIMDITSKIPLEASIEKRTEDKNGRFSRRASLSNRGKRLSAVGNGLIAEPHSSIPIEEFYKHFDQELPDPRKLRQLLVWCCKRIDFGDSKKEQQLVNRANRIKDRFIENLVNGDVEISLWSKESDTNATSSNIEPIIVKPNDANVKNAQIYSELKTKLDKLNAEKAEWVKASSNLSESIEQLPDSKPQVDARLAKCESNITKIDDRIDQDKFNMEVSEVLENLESNIHKVSKSDTAMDMLVKRKMKILSKELTKLTISNKKDETLHLLKELAKCN